MLQAIILLIVIGLPAYLIYKHGAKEALAKISKRCEELFIKAKVIAKRFLEQLNK